MQRHKGTMIVTIGIVLVLLVACTSFMLRAVIQSRSTNAVLWYIIGFGGDLNYGFSSSDWKLSNRALKLFKIPPIVGYDEIDLHTLSITSDYLTNAPWDGCEIHALKLSDTGISDTDISRLRGIKELSELWLANTRCTSRSLEYLLPHKNSLQKLVLGGTFVGPEIDSIRHFNQLRWLWLDQTRIDDSSMAAIGSLRHLENLNISRTNVYGHAIAKLSGCSLKILWAGNTHISDEAARYLAGLQSLEVLSLSSTPFGDTGMTELVKLPRLRILYLTGTNVSKQSVGILKTMPMLEKLIMPGATVDRESLLELLQSKSLKQLGLEGCRLTDKEVADIASSFHCEVWTFSSKESDEKQASK